MTRAELAPFELAGRLALAFGLAVFLGLAFEEVYKRRERSSPGGVRTFPMFALSGAMLYLIEPQHALAFIVGLFALALWLHAYLRNALSGPNATSMMIPTSNLLAYLIGPVALTQPPWMVVAVSVTAVILLGTREQFQRLIQLVPQDELLTAGKFLILVGIVLPLVPNQPVTAATPLTPYHVWLAVVAVCGSCCRAGKRIFSDCTYTTIAYNSCRNRHCPKCQGAAAREWMAARQADSSRCLTSTSSSRCRRGLATSPTKTRPLSMIFCSRPRPRR